jgi:hypothetical protein
VSKRDDDWNAWAIAHVRGAVRNVALDMIIREMRRDPPDQTTLTEAADLLEEILDDLVKPSPDPKEQRHERRRFEARLVQHDVDTLAAQLKRRNSPQPIEQAHQIVALERGLTAEKADAFTENAEGKTLARWLRRNR